MSVPGMKSVIRTFFGQNRKELVRAIASLEPWELPALNGAIYGTVVQVASRAFDPYAIVVVDCGAVTCQLRCRREQVAGLGEGALIEALAKGYRLSNNQIGFDATHIKRLHSFDDDAPLLSLIRLFQRLCALLDRDNDND